MNKYVQMFAASSVSARFSSFKQHAGWRQADRGGCCCGGLFWEVFFPPYRRMIKAAQHNAEKHNVKKALQGPFDTLTHAQQCRQNNTRVVYSLVTHFINHSIGTGEHIYNTSYAIFYLHYRGNGFTTMMTCFQQISFVILSHRLPKR